MILVKKKWSVRDLLLESCYGEIKAGVKLEGKCPKDSVVITEEIKGKIHVTGSGV